MAPPQPTPKTLTQPARDTANALDPPLRRKNPISNEPYDPAKCLETEEPKEPGYVTHNNTNTFNTSGPQSEFAHQNRTSAQLESARIKPSPEDPLGIENLSPKNLASLIASTRKNLNKPGGGFHATLTPPGTLHMLATICSKKTKMTQTLRTRQERQICATDRNRLKRNTRQMPLAIALQATSVSCTSD
eukprot:548915-Pleurochrysis_carterae.AAC.1